MSSKVALVLLSLVMATLLVVPTLAVTDAVGSVPRSISNVESGRVAIDGGSVHLMAVKCGNTKSVCGSTGSCCWCSFNRCKNCC
ncbi:hypothetical protein LINGRAHAP2_LOCUS5702 [Linum grandiflorum]